MDATSRPTDPDRERIELVVELLDLVHQNNGRMAAELDRLLASHATLSDTAIERFLRLAEDLRLGAEARAQLARLDHEAQIAGAAAWIARRRPLSPVSDLRPIAGTAAGSAAARTTARWPGVGSLR